MNYDPHVKKLAEGKTEITTRMISEAERQSYGPLQFAYEKYLKETQFDYSKYVSQFQYFNQYLGLPLGSPYGIYGYGQYIHTCPLCGR